jgi:hypothetical protein
VENYQDPANEVWPDDNHAKHAGELLRRVLDAASLCNKFNLTINFARE